MGVTCVCPWPLSSGKSGQQVVDVLQKNVELAGAQWSGSWCVDCETYQSVSSMGSPTKILHIVHNTEFPMSTFASLENGSCLIADKGFDSVLSKLKGFYEPRKGAKIEAKGQRYELGDFVIKIGQVTVGVSFKGILMEETRSDIINLSLTGRTMRETAENMTRNDLEKWRVVLETIHERRQAVAENPRWTLFRSIFFCTTLLTTIGYGNIAPVTTPGRIFCVIYAFIGIPFNIMFLAVLGKLMADVINKLCAQIIRLWTSYFYPNYEWKSLKGEVEINAPVWLALVIFVSFLCFCSWIYALSENWDYWTACYFTFISFTTIGLGDIVPEREETMVLIDTTLLYIGLTVLALTVNLIVANILHQIKKTSVKLPFVDRLEMSSVTSEINDTKDNGKEND